MIRLQTNPIDRRSIQEGKTYEIVLHPALTIEGQVLSATANQLPAQMLLSLHPKN